MIQEFLYTWVPWTINQTFTVIEMARRAAEAAYTELTVPKQWAFLQSLLVPVSSQIFPNIPIEYVRWQAQTNPPLYIDPRSPIKFKHISYLGITVHLKYHDPVDISAWVNEVKWSGLIEPTPVDLFVLWCCEMGKPYFNLITEIELINSNGDSSKLRA